MELNQVHLVAASVSCDLQQIIHAFKPGFAGQIVRDVGDGNRHNRIHYDVAFIHLVTATYLYMGTLPDTNAAFDYPEPDSRAKTFGKHHMEPYLMATGRDGSQAAPVAPTVTDRPVAAVPAPVQNR